jgi:exonuclease VII large subunit
MLGMVRFFLTNGAKKFISRYGSKALDKVKSYISSNKEKVSKIKTDIKQEPVEKLPLFKKLDKKYVSEGVDFSKLDKGMDISKNMFKNTTSNTRTSLANLKKNSPSALEEMAFQGKLSLENLKYLLKNSNPKSSLFKSYQQAYLKQLKKGK